MENLCIDIGSTKIKYALFSQEERIACGQTPFPSPVKDDGVIYEISASAVFDKVQEIMRAFPAAENVLFSVQMHGHILSLENDVYVSWRDKRSELGGVYKKYEKIFKESLSGKSGTSSKPNLAVYSLLYGYETGKKIGGELFSLGSYLIFRLSGKNVSHITDLCALGFYLEDGNKNEKLCEKLPFQVKLPECAVSFSECGTFGEKKIFSPAGDQQASVFALQKTEDAILNVGTSAQICRVAERGTYGNFESRPYFGDRTLCTRTGLIGGAALRTASDFEKVKAEMAVQYGNAFDAVDAGKNILCTGGAFGFYKDLLAEVVEKTGRRAVFGNGEATDGLNLLYRSIK